MRSRSVLIVDDEKNIRLMLSQVLESLALTTDTAVNGEEALSKLKKKNFGLILLDLKMPGMDGIEVLRQVRQVRPDIGVIIITAYGTIESAVEATRLGAVDYIQKPFAPEEIRELVTKVLNRKKLDAQIATDYASFVELAKRCIEEGQFDAAIEHIRKAVSLSPSRPEGFNLLGVLMEIRGDQLEAQKNYRAAVSLDPTYEPARRNLEQSTLFRRTEGIILEQTPEKKGEEN